MNRPVSGGEREYLDYAYKKPKALLSFAFVQSTVWLVRPGASAAVGVAFGQYMVYAIFGSEREILESGSEFVINNKAWIERGFGTFCVVFSACVHGLAPKLGMTIQNGLSVLKLGVLILLLLTGIIAATGLTSLPRADNYSDIFAGTRVDANAYSSALLAAFFTFDGWNNLNYSLDELIDPIRNLPRAALSAVCITSFLYISAVISYFLVIPIVDIDTKSSVLAAQFFTMTMGETVGKHVIPVFISLSAFGSVMCMTFGASRIIFSATREGFFPFRDYLGATTSSGAPIGGLMLHMTMSLILMLGPPPGSIYQFLIALSVYPAWCFYALTVIGLLYLRFKEPDTLRPFKSFWITNVIFVCVCIFIIFFPFVPPDELPTNGIPYYLHALIGLSWILLCIPIWYFQVELPRKTQAAEEEPLKGQPQKKREGFSHVVDVMHSYSPTLISEDETKLFL